MNFKLLFQINRHKSYGDVSGDVRNLAGVTDYDVIYIDTAKCAVVIVASQHVETVKGILRGKNGYRLISTTRDGA